MLWSRHVGERTHRLQTERQTNLPLQWIEQVKYLLSNLKSWESSNLLGNRAVTAYETWPLSSRNPPYSWSYEGVLTLAHENHTDRASGDTPKWWRERREISAGRKGWAKNSSWGERHTSCVLENREDYQEVREGVSDRMRRAEAGTSLEVHWLRLPLPMQGLGVRSLTRELRVHMQKSQNLKQKDYQNKFNKDFKKWSTLKKS